MPNKPIRFVVNSHPHFDHASRVAAAIAKGATILTHRNNEEILERLLSGPRTLIGDSLAKASNSDGMVAVYLPAEKVLWTADISVVNPTPAQAGVVRSAVEVFNRLKLDYNTWLPAHPPNPDRPLTKADVMAAAAPSGS